MSSETKSGAELPYIKSLSDSLLTWPEYRALRDKLVSISSENKFGLALVDFLKAGSSRCQSYSHESPNWTEGLEAPLPGDVGQRVVIFRHSDNDCNGEIISKIGDIYSVEPIVFQQFLNDDEGKVKENLIYYPSFRRQYDEEKRQSAFAEPPISTTKYTEVGLFSSFKCLLSVRMPEEEQMPAPIIVLIFLKTTCFGAGLPDYLEPLNMKNLNERKYGPDFSVPQYIAERLRFLNDETFEYMRKTPAATIIPVLDLYIAAYSQMLAIKETHAAMRSIENENSADMAHQRYVLEGRVILDRMCLSSTMRNIKATCPVKADGPISELFKIRINDLEDLQSRYVWLSERIERRFSRKDAELNVQLTKQSLDNADSVGRLTALAFFFIPLSFVTSIFGMNVSLFGSGPVEIWVVIVTAVTVFMLAVLVWMLSRHLFNAFRALRDVFRLIRDTIIVLVKFFWALRGSS